MKKSVSDKILYRIVGWVIKLYTESTQEWATQTVENLEGRKIKKTTLGETKEMANNNDLNNIIFHLRDDDDDDIVKIFAGDEHQTGLTAVVIALKYRLKQYWAVPLAPVIICLLAPSEMTIANIGVYFDLFGAVIITRGLYRTPSEISAQSMMTAPVEPHNDTFNPLGDPVERLVLAVETVDSMIGSMLLVVGFSLQLLAKTGGIVTSAVLLLTIIIWFGLRS